MIKKEINGNHVYQLSAKKKLLDIMLLLKRQRKRIMKPLALTMGNMLGLTI